MSDRPEENRPAQEQSASGWFAPPNTENIPDSPPPSGADVPLPGTTPAQAGAWFTPEVPPVPVPAPAPAPAEVPQGAALSTEGNYDNYVPGVGFVPKSTPAPAPATTIPEPAPVPVTPIVSAEPAAPTATAAPVVPTTSSTPLTVDAIPVPPQPAPILPQSDDSDEGSDDEPTPNIGPAPALPVIPGLAVETPAPEPAVAERPIPLPRPQPAPQPVSSTPAPVSIAPVQSTPAPVSATQPAPAPAPLTVDTERAAVDAAIRRPEPEPVNVEPVQTVSPEEVGMPTPEELAATPLAQRYTEVEQAVQVLRRRYSVGRITSQQLQSELRRLMILDETGNWWMIGLETDRWYKYNGRDWVPSDPPGRLGGSGYGITGRADSGTSLGKPVILAKPSIGGTAASTGETRRYAIPEEDEGPLPQRVPTTDPQATVVGRAAPRLDNIGGVAPYDGGVTVPSQAVGATRATYTSEATVPSASVSASGDVVPAPGSSLEQPNYGPNPSSLTTDRHRLSRYLIIFALVMTFLVLAGSLLGALGAVLYYSSVVSAYSQQIDALPQTVQAQSQSVTVFDINGNALSTKDDPNLGKRIYVPLNQISPDMIAATIATEDKRFYDNPGFDVVGIARAVLANFGAGSAIEGASSITQQLTRSLILESGAANDRSSTRKIKEIFVSSEVSRRYSKSQILEYYLNTVYYGNLAYGVEAASQIYFKKSAKDLNLAEAAFLAGLVQAPATYDPAVHPNAAFLRMDDVLALIGKLGPIQMEHAPYNNAPYVVNQQTLDHDVVLIAQVKVSIAQFKPPSSTSKYPHFTNYVWQQLEDKYGKDALYRSGYKIYTTLDPNVQDIANKAVQDQISRLKNLNVNNGAVLVMRTDGAIIAMVGSADFNSVDPRVAGQVNVTLAPRQPGSSIKPIVYYAALDRNQDKNGAYLTPASVLWDVPTTFAGGYRPTNYDNLFHGPQTVRNSLANSLNIPAVKTLDFVGVDRFASYATKFGITFPQTQPKDAGLSAALGGVEVTMYDMVRAYSVFANQGKLVTPYVITKVTHREVDTTVKDSIQYKDVTDFDITTTDKPPSVQVADPHVTYLITNILSDNNARSLEFGLNSPLYTPGRPTAVKTGTTNDFKDNWTIGYTPQLVVGVWVGNSNGEPMRGTSGITGAAPIWNTVITGALKGQPSMDFPNPGDIGSAKICADWGTQDFVGCKNERNEIYWNPNPITPPTDIFQRIDIDTFTGQKANASCQEYKQSQLFVKIDDPTAISWFNTTPQGKALADNYQLTLPLATPPTAECDPNIPRPVVQVATPQSGQTLYRGPIEIRGTVRMLNFQSYEIDLGKSNAQSDADFVKVAGPYGQPTADNAFLGSWDASTIDVGQYTLRLVAQDQAGHKVKLLIPVVISDNVPAPATATPDTGSSPIFGATATPATDLGFPTMTPIVIGAPTLAPASNATPTPRPLFAPTYTPNP
jgi:penicillin-binding protein 1C